MLYRASGVKKKYKITLPNNEKITLWFIGKQLETLLKAYNIQYEIVK